MNFSRLIVVTVSIILTPLFVINAGPVNRKNRIGMQMGMWNQVTGSRCETGYGLTTTTVEANGFMGGISYEHLFLDNMALTFFAGGMLASVETYATVRGTTTETAVVVPVLFGLKYYFVGLTSNPSVRPFARAAVGPFTGEQEKTEEDFGRVVVEDRSESTIGGQIGAGVDFMMNSFMMMEFGLGYNLMSDFDRPIGGSRNYSGPQFNFGMSFVF